MPVDEPEGAVVSGGVKHFGIVLDVLGGERLKELLAVLDHLLLVAPAWVGSDGDAHGGKGDVRDPRVGRLGRILQTRKEKTHTRTRKERVREYYNTGKGNDTGRCGK